MRKAVKWLRFISVMCFFSLPLGAAWAGPAIGLLMLALGAGHTLMACLLGIACAVGWMSLYFPEGLLRGMASESAQEKAFKETDLYRLANGFGLINVAINAVITFFGGSMAVNAWLSLLNIRVGFSVRLVLCAYAGMVGGLSALWVTRVRINQAAMHAEKASLSAMRPLVVAALICAGLATACSMISAYFSGFYLFEKMVALLGSQAVSFVAILGTPVGQTVLASVLTGCTAIAAAALFSGSTIEKFEALFAPADPSAPARTMGQWVRLVGIMSLATVASAVQVFSVYSQLASLLPWLVTYRIVPVLLTGIGLNFATNFGKGLDTVVGYTMELLGYAEFADKDKAVTPPSSGVASNEPLPPSLVASSR